MEVAYTPSFIRQYKALSNALQAEVKKKITQFEDEKNHQALHVHKLSGKLKDQYSFRVNCKVRIVFHFGISNPKEAILLAVGSHDVYD